MAKAPLLGFVVLAALATAARADVTVTPALVSDYDFRGITQSDRDPAVQLGIDYDFTQGFYVRGWGSTVDYGRGDPDLQVDVGGGYRGGDASGAFAYDVGLVGRTFPGASRLNYVEAYAGITRGMFGGRLWVSPDFNGSGRSAWYLEGNVSMPLVQRLALDAHVGFSDGSAWRAVNGYYDWSMGLSWSARQFSLGLKYVDGEHPVADGRVMGSVSVKLPWSAQ